MSLDQLKAFPALLSTDMALRQTLMAAATADDLAQIAGEFGYQFSGDELLHLSGRRWAASR